MPIAHHHTWEMVALVSGSGGPGMQGILQRSVEMFHQVVGLGVGYPAVKQGSGAICSSDGGEGNRLWPPGGSVNHCEQIPVTARGRKQPNQSTCIRAKTVVQHRYVSWLELNMPMDFVTLAEQAGPSHQSDGLGHLWPAKSGCDEAPCSPHTMMIDMECSD
jgi:hypothetical protein